MPDFVPSVANRIASCVPGPSSYLDTDNLTSGITYYYVVRAEDNSTGNGGACGGNEESNNVHIAGTAYGSGTQATTSTWTDGGGDVTAFLRLNATGTGNTADPAWRIVRTADDPGANHTAGGAYAYRNAGPGPDAIYSSIVCASAETPILTVGATSVNLRYWERHELEKRLGRHRCRVLAQWGRVDQCPRAKQLGRWLRAYRHHDGLGAPCVHRHSAGQRLRVCGRRSVGHYGLSFARHR